MGFIKSKEEIIEIAKNVLSLSEFTYNDEEDIRSNMLEKDDTANYYHKNVWVVSFLWQAEEYGRMRSAGLYIDDEKGLPLHLVHTMGQVKILFEYNEATSEITTSTGFTFNLE